MNRQDTLEIEILEDGRIKTTSPGSISAANHANAEAFMRYIATVTDGNVQRGKIAHTHTHHSHGQTAKEGA